MKRSNIVVKQDEAAKVPYEVIAQSIVDISKFANEVKRSRLNEKAILVLVQNITGVGQGVVKQVLDGLADLERIFVRR